MADVVVVEVALSQLRQAINSVEVHADRSATIPNDSEQRWEWFLLLSVVVDVSRREIKKCERRYDLFEG